VGGRREQRGRDPEDATDVQDPSATAANVLIAVDTAQPVRR
jgi:hypothetical protein